MENKNLFSINLLNFIKYKKNVVCDKRVFFEAILIKHISYKKKPFYYSKNEILAELGIKRNRAERIIKELSDNGFLRASIIVSSIDGQPRQVTYFEVVEENIPEVARKLMIDSSEFIKRLELK